MTSPIVIIGGGIMGMVTAALLRKRHPEKPIYLIEKSSHAGGLYTSVHYPDGGYFDYGMHILYDTGIDEIDDFLHSLLPEDQWHRLEGNYKDIAGIFWQGRLQQHSPYPDLRFLPPEELRRCTEGIYEAAQKKSPADFVSAKHYFEEHFGKPVAGYWQQVIEKLYDAPAEQISVCATRQPAMNRVILKSIDDMDEVMQSAGLRTRIAYPDQMQLPAIRTASQCGWYPKKFGMIHVIKALQRHLLASNVTFIFNATVDHLVISNNRVDALHVRSEASAVMLENIENCYWTAGMGALGKLLGSANTAITIRPKAAHIYMRFAEPLQMGALYQFYCFDAGYRTFRVTNYTNYCPDARSALGYPICLEYWPKESVSEEELFACAMDELRRFGVIAHDATPTFKAIQHVPNHHDMFLRSSMYQAKNITDSIREKGLKNLVNIGLSAGEGRLLLYEILQDAYAKLQ